jgi:hypothetical protein
LSEEGGGTEEEDERAAGQTLDVIHMDPFVWDPGRMAASSLAVI